jgi:hypothetical protein
MARYSVEELQRDERAGIPFVSVYYRLAMPVSAENQTKSNQIRVNQTKKYFGVAQRPAGWFAWERPGTRRVFLRMSQDRNLEP